MPVVLATLGSILAKLGWMLLTEHVVKYVMVYTAELAAKSSQNDFDDKLVEQVKKAWNIE
jgi:hypothetical protein